MNVAQLVRIVLDLRLRQKRDAFLVRCQYGVEQRYIAGRNFLRHLTNAPARGQADFAEVGVQLVQDGLEQRGFARAVAPDERGAPSRRQRSTRAFQNLAARNADGDVVDDQHDGGDI
jgi:hypothetical protein